jgi:FkbM family methyltransferase
MIRSELPKQWMRALRGHRLLNPVISAPFVALRDSGVPLPRQLTKHLAFTGLMDVTVPGGEPFRMATHGWSVENEVFWHGVAGHEPEAVPLWLAWALRSSVVLDIGANTGLYSLLASSVQRNQLGFSMTASPCSHSVHAFEPIPRVGDLLQKNVSLNPGCGITVHRCAVGAKSGVATIHDPGGANCYSASLNSEFLDVAKTSYEVPVVSVDDWVVRTEVDSLDLVKIDVEGFEAAVLNGMVESIKRFRPVIMLEFLSHTDTSLVKAIMSLLAQDYLLLHPAPDGVSSPSAVLPNPAGRNVFLCPREKTVPSLASVLPGLTTANGYPKRVANFRSDLRAIRT